MEPRGTNVDIQGASKPAIVHKNGMVIFGNDGKMVSTRITKAEEFIYKLTRLKGYQQ
jgi:formyltetrahydrofolate dehydrogenase